MYTVVGHDQLRHQIRDHHGPLALIGPAGVGKRGIAHEHATRQLQPVLNLTLAELPQALDRPSLTYVLDASTVTTWTPLLNPLEQGSINLIVTSDHDLPRPVSSRLATFHVGYLRDHEITRILAEQHPRATPRPVITHLAAGTLADLDLLTRAAALIQDVDQWLKVRQPPNLRDLDPLALLTAVKAICRTVLGLPGLMVTEATRTIPKRLAAELVAITATTRYQARNALALFFSRVYA